MTKPLTAEQLKRRILGDDLEVVMAPAEEVAVLKPHCTRILNAIGEMTGIKGAWISDESCFSDFMLGEDDFDELSSKLGIKLDYANWDDHYIVKVAMRLRQLHGEPAN